jgi:hypothetical protein
MSTYGFGSRHGAFPYSSANQSLAVRSHGWRTASLLAAANLPAWAASPATPSAASASSQPDAAQPAPAATQRVAIEGFRSAKCGKGRSRK